MFVLLMVCVPLIKLNQILMLNKLCKDYIHSIIFEAKPTIAESSNNETIKDWVYYKVKTIWTKLFESLFWI